MLFLRGSPFQIQEISKGPQQLRELAEIQSKGGSGGNRFHRQENPTL